ncbi:hypothetical protein [Sphaerothrix gracilis]|uniref:hypothetical protein n=1 Tax=Sphaerothrix gracilis TaxID=3151835 RepID=UPI0031FD6F79
MNSLIILLLIAGYGYGAWRFWRGFHRTNFSQGRLQLTLLWPVFLIANKSYRQNFSKALKGR